MGRHKKYKDPEEGRKVNLERSRQSRKEREAKFQEFKRKPCEDCGITYPPQIMHFHHKDPQQKNTSINEAKRGPWHLMVEEIQKCVVLCPTCHALRHFNDGWVKPNGFKERKEEYNRRVQEYKDDKERERSESVMEKYMNRAKKWQNDK